MHFGVDVSNHQGEITPDIAACFAQAGHTCAVVRLSLERGEMIALARRQIQALQGAGLTVMGYIWCYFSEDPDGTAQAALDTYGDLGLAFWWLDAEEVDPRWNGDSPAQRHDWLDTCVSVFEEAGLPVGIYTANWWWGPYMADAHGFGYLPLWVAEYDDRPDLSVFFPFGGWAACAGKQYTGSGSLCGVRPIDLNVFDDALFGSAPPENGEDPMADEVLINRLGYLQGDVADVLENEITAALTARNRRERDSHLASALAAVNTLRHEGE